MTGYSGTPLVKKLGIRHDTRLLVLGAPKDYRTLLAGLPDGAQLVRKPSPTTNLAHVFCTRERELKQILARLRRRLPPSARVWVSWPKKSARVPTEITEDDVRAVALPLGFVDVKVCAVDDVWSGLKLVVRQALR